MRILVPVLAALLALGAGSACDEYPGVVTDDGRGPGDPGPGPGPGPDPDPGPGPGPAFVLLLVGNPGSLNESERALESRLGTLGREVRVRDDDGFETGQTGGCGLVVVSKTVSSNRVGSRLRPVSCPVLFWEDNAQMIHMVSTIDNDGSNGTTWHGTENDIYVRSDAPASLRAGISGEVDIYTRHDEITFAPREDLVDDAIVVAEFDEAGGDPVIYALERGARLADGSSAAGRRVYFGLYDDTFRLLNAQGLALFDAAVAWALR